jgi:hypothetical protein
MEQFLLVTNGVPGVESVTVAVKLKVPAAVGAPVMAPLLVLSVKPAGSTPAVMENL